MPSDIPRNYARTRDDITVHNSAVCALCLLIPNLAREKVMCHVILCRDHNARGILVEAVHDAGTQRAVDAGEILTVPEQRIDQRSRIDARSRVNHHAAGLVDDDDVRILIEHVKRDVLCTNLHLFGGRQRIDDLLSAAQFVVRLAHRAVHCDPPILNEALRIAAREIRQLPYERTIQPLPRTICGK